MSITLDAGGSVIIYNGNEAATYKHDDLVSLGTYNGCNVTYAYTFPSSSSVPSRIAL